ncbi:MAG: PLP-dependent aminotransferase family protein [Firmicutes bacterium]|nr:PLP-dependent aminotransferase family protein [Bacillota bacterium]
MTVSIDKNTKEPKYMQLYGRLRDGITSGLYSEGEKLPSKRDLAMENGVSVVSAEHALSLLADEGYIESRERSGHYVIFSEKEMHGQELRVQEAPGSGPSLQGPHGAPPSEGAADLSGFPSDPSEEPSKGTDPAAFPFSVFARTMRRVISEYGETLLIKSPNSGCIQLRTAISAYLAKNRGMHARPELIIIGAGAEFLYGLLVQILGRGLTYAVENPSYEKIEQVYLANDVKVDRLALGRDGILSSELRRTDADVLHISPFRSYPSGVTASASKRREYIRWAESRPKRTIIEDDFESEFSTSSKAEDTVFSLAKRGNVIYLNTFSKTVAPSIRAGYMILPEELLPLYRERAGFYSCAVPTFEQYALAEFIENGDFERHINRVRRAARKKLQDARSSEGTRK